MKGYIEKLIPAVPVALVLGAMMFSHSCANTTTPPSGGDKDTIPPVITNISPLPGTVNVPVHNTQIVITFNEYVTVKDAKGIFLSPPLEKSPKYKIRGKSLVVYFESDLEPNTTYTLDLTPLQTTMKATCIRGIRLHSLPDKSLIPWLLRVSYGIAAH